MLRAGCVFQERFGWERPGWFNLSRGDDVSVREYDWLGSYGNKEHKTEEYGYKRMLSKDYTFDYPEMHELVGKVSLI